MKEPRVSIVMPVFNGGEWLRQAIDSIQNQSLTDFEFIIIDDGSTDHSDLVLAEAARGDTRIRIVHQHHLGVAVAINKGIALARSQFVARMDADDIAHPERLQLQLTFLQKHPHYAALGSWAYVIDEQGRAVGHLKPEIDSTTLHGLLTKQNPFIHSSMVFSTDIARRLGGYRTILEGAEDYDLWLRISERGLLTNLPEFLLSYRRHFVSTIYGTKQLLAARLARMSAAERRASGLDFVDHLHLPLSLVALGDHEKLRTTADFYRMLDQPADETIRVGALRCLGRTDLNHAERKAAQIWLKEALKNNKGCAFRTLALFWLFYLHPPRGVSLVWSMLKTRPPS
jgi:glycosyltransferase involved in cell wall biosynthesis